MDIRLEISRLNSEIEALKGAQPASEKLTDTGRLRQRYYLHERISKYFDAQELRDLMYYFGIDPENVHAAGHRDRCLQFVLYLQRRGKTPQLIERLEVLRPLVKWEHTGE